MSDPHHYPTELSELLVNTIPRLVKSKESVLDFFTSAGVSDAHTSDLRARLQTDRGGINKFEIARTVIKRINAAGDPALRARREILKRVTEWDDFSSCWEDKVLEAKGLVAEVQSLVGKKDSFTRMAQEREREVAERRKVHEKKIAEVQTRNARVVAVRERFGACFAVDNAQRRGKELEGVLNEFFAIAGIGVREAFHVAGVHNEGIIEQIDGAIEIDGRLFIVEMKWWSQPLGTAQVAQHLVRVFQRAGCGGIVIAHPGLSGPAVSNLRDALVHGATVFGVSLEGLFRVLQADKDLRAFIKARIEAATLERNPYLDGALNEG